MVSPAPTSSTVTLDKDSKICRAGTGGEGDGNGAGADIGFGTHALGHRERFLEHPLQFAHVEVAAAGIGEGFFT